MNYSDSTTHAPANTPTFGSNDLSTLNSSGSTSNKHSTFQGSTIRPFESHETLSVFRKIWRTSTADNNLTIYGFRRFKTSHLLNLRFLEEEIAELDHTIYQSGLQLGVNPTPIDRLGLNHIRMDMNAPLIEDTINKDFVLRLRELLKQYDEAIVVFNQIMAMETFSLLDDEQQSSLRTDLTPYEIYNTRLVRLDLGTRIRQDPFQRQLHKWLRAFRYWSFSRKHSNPEAGKTPPSADHRWSYQNTVFIAEAISRCLISLVGAFFFVAPLAILSSPRSQEVQLTCICIFVVAFSFLVSLAMKTTNLETLTVSAAYAAVLSVFVSSSSSSSISAS